MGPAAECLRGVAQTGLAALRRWGVSAASLVAGVLALVVFRRGMPHVGWIVGYLVVLGLCYTLVAQLRLRTARVGRERLLAAGDYTVQTLYHGLCLFILPGYVASAPIDAPSGLFVLGLAAVALLTAVDPWYRALVRPGGRVEPAGLAQGLFAFVVFAALNVALPLVGVPPPGAVLASAALAGLGAVAATVAPRGAWTTASARLAAVGALAVGLAWLLLPAIPPAPVHLVHPTLAAAVVDREPIGPVGSRIPVATLAGGLVAYTPIAAPAGLRQAVVHEWRHEGRLISVLPLPGRIVGGRPGGFRTYSRKTDFPPHPFGGWTVDVVTASGQLIGRLRFAVTP